MAFVYTSIERRAWPWRALVAPCYVLYRIQRLTGRLTNRTQLPMTLVIHYNSFEFSRIPADFPCILQSSKVYSVQGENMNYMTKDEISRVLLAASSNRRDYLMIYLGYFAGLRAMEVCSLQRRDFDISTAAIYVTVQRSKGSDKTRH